MTMVGAASREVVVVAEGWHTTRCCAGTGTKACPVARTAANANAERRTIVLFTEITTEVNLEMNAIAVCLI